MDWYFCNGIDVDWDGLSKFFRMFKFEVRVYNNCIKVEICNIVKEMVNYNYFNYNVFIFLIFIYGEEGVIYGIDGIFIIKEIILEFKYFMFLVGKFKFFFF